MPEAANAHDTHAGARRYVELHQRIEHRDPGAEQWPRRARIQAGWQRHYTGCICPYLISEGAVSTDDGALRLGAEIVVPGHTVGAGFAIGGLPAQPDPVAQRQIADAVNMVLSGEMEPKAALDAAAEEVNELLSDY